jgi:hypothetical protein
MTLIVTFASEDYCVIASDRRISWTDDEGNQTDWEDTENKAIVIHGRWLMGYTGPARLDDLNTDAWAVQAIADPSSSNFVEAIRVHAERAIDDLRQVEGALRGLAFVIAGYYNLRSTGPDVFHAGIAVVSNALADDGSGWQPRSDFKAIASPPVQGPVDFRLRAIGRAPAQEELERAARAITTFRAENPGKVRGVIDALVQVIRDTAVVDSAVGQAVSVSVLPRSAVPAGGVATPTTVGLLDDPITELTCMLVPADDDLDGAIIYGPAMVGAEVLMWGAEVTTVQPDWWSDP